MTVSYDVVFDLGSSGLGPLFKLAVGLCLAAFCSFFFLTGKASVALRALLMTVPLVIATLSINTFVVDRAGHQRVQSAIRQGGLMEIEGTFRSVDLITYSIGEHTFRISSNTRPALSAAPAWLSRNLEGRCVRVRYTEQREIIWAAVLTPAGDCSDGTNIERTLPSAD